MCTSVDCQPVAVVGRRRDVQLDPGLVEREAGERHVVLPADEAAEPAVGRLDRLEPAAVAGAPDEALVVRRHELAVLQRQVAVGPVEEERVVEGARVRRVALGHAGHEPDLVLAGELAEPALGGAGYLDRLAGQQREGLLGALLGPAGKRLRPDRGRIGRDHGLREDDQARALGGGFGGRLAELLDRGVPVEDHRLDLGTGDGQALMHAPSLSAHAQERLHAERGMVGERAPEPVAAALHADRDRAALAGVGHRDRERVVPPTRRTRRS